MGNRPAASPRARSSCLFGRLVCDITRKESRMKPISVIPCLDMKDGRVVKGVNFVGLRQDSHGNRRGVYAPLGLGLRHPLDAVYSTFVF